MGAAVRRALLLLLVAALLLVSAPQQTFAQVVIVDNQAGLPNLHHAEVVIPAAEVATLFTAPVTVAPAISGKIISLEAFHIRKQAGTGWTTTGSGTLRITFTLTPFSQEAGIFDQSATTAFFGASEAVWQGIGGKGQFQALGNTTGGNGMNGAGLRLALGTANISGGTGSLIVNVWYRYWEGF